MLAGMYSIKHLKNGRVERLVLHLLGVCWCLFGLGWSRRTLFSVKYFATSFSPVRFILSDVGSHVTSPRVRTDAPRFWRQDVEVGRSSLYSNSCIWTFGSEDAHTSPGLLDVLTQTSCILQAQSPIHSFNTYCISLHSELYKLSEECRK